MKERESLKAKEIRRRMQVAHNRRHITPEDWETMLNDVSIHFEYTAEQAERLLSETLNYLVAYSYAPGIPPSPMVDETWALIFKHDALYRRVCRRLCGKPYVEYAPLESRQIGFFTKSKSQTIYEMTENRHFEVDSSFWKGFTTLRTSQA